MPPPSATTVCPRSALRCTSQSYRCDAESSDLLASPGGDGVRIERYLAAFQSPANLISVVMEHGLIADDVGVTARARRLEGAG